ncbi:unnamed protein product [Mycena citricolor]|uniref:Uncharacterized protein n=1 Tax=Mycena citricolor TaxID=2018698 RepID=A0AAD2HQH7_9AGAR|nr:unnamed protein product [Mycena citricolor]
MSTTGAAWEREDGGGGRLEMFPLPCAFGAANFVSIFATFCWLGCFECAGRVPDDAGARELEFDISRAAICLVTEPTVDISKREQWPKTLQAKG